ncbi:putative late blight resistance protein homolog R1B-16 [Solanum verrucosum]|uniref:putative late blight resistance protein homolog R1B-16 n=1 Tax=Solanum verrucosum TaxID=315347 RepID=UPI0020D129B6|nr:putative late blight resistance protein homolog R1B-16 [Solanum verrucosum]
MEVLETCGKGTLSAGEPSTKRSLTSIYDDDEVVGFEKHAEIIMKKLIRGTKERDLISIFGMPGLGKTTLATKVYNNPSIVNYFDVKSLCAVSQAYNRRTLLVEIFKQATNDKIKIKEDDDVADMLRRVLIGKRYLIVLDDIWDVEAWDDLGICFPQGEYGSRVMVTTRIEQVAKHLLHHSDPYSLSFLTSEESWELLEKKVFRGESCPPDLLEAGLQVAQHCKGLPLVVVLIAGMIAKMDKEASLWLKVASDLSSIGLGEQSMKVIQSSYDHLEDHLKPCLLYMALFPEDHKIPVNDLLKLWMAEEFVLNVETENMEEASRNCLSDLLNRSLVMVSGMRINCDVQYCSLHDVVREFCLRKLTEDKYMQLPMPYNPYQHLYSTESRLCIYIHDDLVKQLDHPDYKLDKILMLDFKETNSLEFIAHPKLNTWNNQYWNPLDLLVKLRFVRALHLMDVELPDSWATAIQSLTELRYLALYVRQFELEWISHLHNLQTLQVKSSNKSIRAATLWEMKKLRHVNIDSFPVVWEDINDEGSFEESSTTMLENMKTFHICDIRLDNVNARLWWRFPNLEELSLKVEDEPKFPLFPIPEVHTHLQSVSLMFSFNKVFNSVGWERYFVFPSNIRHLFLFSCFFTEDMVLNIARLKKLESLTLLMGFPDVRLQTFRSCCWDVTNVEFPALKYLGLFFMQMKEWKASEESFPVLEKLVINGVFIKEIPPSFADIPTLTRIELTNCIDSLGVSAMNIKREIEENTGCDSLHVVVVK